jgi:hypothetical protein
LEKLSSFQSLVMNTGPQKSAPPEFWRLWKVADVSRALGMSRTWVYEKAESGKLLSAKGPASPTQAVLTLR